MKKIFIIELIGSTVEVLDKCYLTEQAAEDDLQFLKEYSLSENTFMGEYRIRPLELIEG